MLYTTIVTGTSIVQVTSNNSTQYFQRKSENYINFLRSKPSKEWFTKDTADYQHLKKQFGKQSFPHWNLYKLNHDRQFYSTSPTPHCCSTRAFLWRPSDPGAFEFAFNKRFFYLIDSFVIQISARIGRKILQASLSTNIYNFWTPDKDYCTVLSSYQVYYFYF